MTNNLSKQYAKALFELATENNEIEDVYDNLIILKEAFNNQSFKDIIQSITISKEEKKQIIKNILINLNDSYFLYFHYVLIDNNRFDVYDQIVDAYKELLQDYLKIIEIDVYTKYNLNNLEKEKLTNNLQKRFNKKPIINYHLDNNLMGGIKVITDDIIIDYTLDSQLKEIKNSIMKG